MIEMSGDHRGFSWRISRSTTTGHRHRVLTALKGDRALRSIPIDENYYDGNPRYVEDTIDRWFGPSYECPEEEATMIDESDWPEYEVTEEVHVGSTSRTLPKTTRTVRALCPSFAAERYTMAVGRHHSIDQPLNLLVKGADHTYRVILMGQDRARVTPLD